MVNSRMVCHTARGVVRISIVPFMMECGNVAAVKAPMGTWNIPPGRSTPGCGITTSVKVMAVHCLLMEMNMKVDGPMTCGMVRAPNATPMEKLTLADGKMGANMA